LTTELSTPTGDPHCSIKTLSFETHIHYNLLLTVTMVRMNKTLDQWRCITQHLLFLLWLMWLV